MRILYDYDLASNTPAAVTVTSVEIDPDNSRNGYHLVVYRPNIDNPIYFKASPDECLAYIRKIAETGWLDLTDIPYEE